MNRKIFAKNKETGEFIEAELIDDPGFDEPGPSVRRPTMVESMKSGFSEVRSELGNVMNIVQGAKDQASSLSKQFGLSKNTTIAVGLGIGAATLFGLMSMGSDSKKKNPSKKKRHPKGRLRA